MVAADRRSPGHAPGTGRAGCVVVTFYPTHDNGLLDDRLDRIDADNPAEWPAGHPEPRDLLPDAREDEQERLRAEAEYARTRREYQ